MFLNLPKLQTLWEFHGRLKPAAGLGAPQMIQDGTVLMAVAMQTWIPLTTSFVFLAVMWKSGVAEMRSCTVEVVVQSLSGFTVAMQDVPSSSGLGSNPLSRQSSSDSQLLELELHA